MKKKKLHILFLSSWYPTPVILNNGNFIKKHAEAVAKLHEVSVLFVISSSKVCNITIENFFEKGVHTKIYYVPKYTFLVKKMYVFLKIYLKEIWNNKQLDLIHVNILNPVGIFALLFKYLKGIPYIISEHHACYLKEKYKQKKIYSKYLDKWIAFNASSICPVSNMLKNAMIYHGLNGNYHVVGNIVDTSIFKPICKKKSDLFTITHVSNFSEAKNISAILKVYKNILSNRSDCLLKIAGDGDLIQLKRQVDQWQIPKENIQIIGPRTPSKVSFLLQSSDLYISFSNYETFGITIAEAISCGIHVIASNTGIAPMLASQDFLTVIPVGDEVQLEDKILQEMTNPSKFDRDQAHQMMHEFFGEEQIANNFSSIYQKALTSNTN
jgi:glycosyltransferase involved in cell wall biosynthesis